MTSPGSSVMASDRIVIRVATSKIMSDVLPSCMSAPFTLEVMRSPAAPGGNASASIRSGPKPPVRSKFLPMVHCVDFRW